MQVFTQSSEWGCRMKENMKSDVNDISEQSDKSAVQKKKGIFQTVVFAIIIVCVFLLIFWLIWCMLSQMFPELLSLLSSGNQQAISDYISHMGAWKGMLMVYLISILQVVSIFIPGIVIQLSAGLVFPWPIAFSLCYLGFVTGNVLVFFVARRLGNRVLNKLPIMTKMQWLKDNTDPRKMVFYFALACLVPGVPNGVIPYAAATTSIRGKGFAIAILASSWVQILSNCVAGHFLIRAEYLY
ncbi:MAG: TVP38/TMEM64 family protein, partial [Erysipelotrichia bacterium]|nr:TVP38/TMEM64 family protein [Erysipelotrichia bacterium]